MRWENTGPARTGVLFRGPAGLNQKNMETAMNQLAGWGRRDGMDDEIATLYGENDLHPHDQLLDTLC